MLSLKYPPTLKALGPQEWIALLFGCWLLLAVVTPENVYRTFFHVLIYPLTLYVLIWKGGASLAWKDPFVRLFLLVCAYMAVTTWFVGGVADDDLQASRWGAEAALGMVAFFYWMRSLVPRSELWGMWFLVVAFIGALCGLLIVSPEKMITGRYEGLGAMAQPIQGASIASAFLALGLFLTFHKHDRVTWKGGLLAALSVIAVWSFVILTQSRGPLVALSAYLIFFTIFLCCRYRKLYLIFVLVGVLACFIVFVHVSVGLFALFEQMASRGSSYRLDLWLACLSHPPESLLLGNGAGVDFKETDAWKLYLEPRGMGFIEHPHSLWLGTYVETGLIGVVMLLSLVLLPAIATFRSGLALSVKLQLVALLGLFLLLTFTDEFTLLISLHPVWLFGWTLLVFVWTFARYPASEKAVHEFKANPGGQPCR